MRLTVVGDAAAWTRRRGHPSSCYLVEHGGRIVVLDFGQGAFAELAQYAAPETIDGIVISHLHADHLVDLIPLRHYLTYEATDGHPLELHAPADLGNRLDAFQAHTGFLDRLAPIPLMPGTFRVAGLTVEARHVTHIPDSFAFRLAPGDREGAGLVYSGDCGVAADLEPLVRPGDTLLCEAALGTRPNDNAIHLNADEAAGVAQARHARTLLLTHIQDRSDRDGALRAAQVRFAGPVSLTEPGLVVDIA